MTLEQLQERRDLFSDWLDYHINNRIAYYRQEAELWDMFNNYGVMIVGGRRGSGMIAQTFDQWLLLKRRYDLFDNAMGCTFITKVWHQPRTITPKVKDDSYWLEIGRGMSPREYEREIMNFPPTKEQIDYEKAVLDFELSKDRKSNDSTRLTRFFKSGMNADDWGYPL